MPRPFAVRLAGIDLSIGGPPLAADISRLFTSHAAAGPPPPPLVVHPPPAPPDPPAGFRANTLTRVIGHGPAHWARASRALETADAFDLPWARFWRGGKGNRWAVGDPVVVGARVVSPGLWVANVNRVVDVRRGRNRVAVAWATTARHVLRGEEVVAVERRRNGDVVFSLRSYSRPRSLVAWLTYPYVAYLQRKFAHSVAWRVEQIARAPPTAVPT
jgi:uncharacterized protein (UPF0548 family)